MNALTKAFAGLAAVVLTASGFVSWQSQLTLGLREYDAVTAAVWAGLADAAILAAGVGLLLSATRGWTYGWWRFLMYAGVLSTGVQNVMASSSVELVAVHLVAPVTVAALVEGTLAMSLQADRRLARRSQDAKTTVQLVRLACRGRKDGRVVRRALTSGLSRSLITPSEVREALSACESSANWAEDMLAWSAGAVRTIHVDVTDLDAVEVADVTAENRPALIARALQEHDEDVAKTCEWLKSHGINVSASTVYRAKKKMELTK